MWVIRVCLVVAFDGGCCVDFVDWLVVLGLVLFAWFCWYLLCLRCGLCFFVCFVGLIAN